MRQIFIIVLFGIFILACKSTDDNRTQKNSGQSDREIQESLIEYNRKMLKEERDQIKAWTDSTSWSFLPTGTGVLFTVFENSSEKLIRNEDIVTLNYKLSTLNGLSLKSSSENGNLTFRVGRDGQAEIGLHEVLKKLHEGDSAAIVIPSHLAHGVVGDLEQIPPRTSLVYYLRVSKVEYHN